METHSSIATETRAPAFTGCCPRFNPEPFQEKEIAFQDEWFVKEQIRSLFHVPVNMGKRVTAANAVIEAAGAQPAVPLMLSDEKSAWTSDLYLRVTKEIPGATMAKLPGKYLTKVFEGPFRDAPKWVEQMKAFVSGRGEQLEKIYFAYTTCPACAKAYGVNYVVLFAKLRE